MNESNTTTGTPWFKAGEFFKVTKPQFRAKMAPSCDLKTRVWACLMLHTAGFRGELAQVIRKNKTVPMRLTDVARELRQVEEKYYQEAEIQAPSKTTDWNLRRALRDLEQDGVCQRCINGQPIQADSKLQSKEIQIFVWFEPRKPERQIVKRTRILQEPAPIQTGLFDRRSVRQIEKMLHVIDPQKLSFLKLASSDPEHAKTVAIALAKAGVLFSAELPEGELQLVKSDVGATKICKVGRGRNEKSDVGATKPAPHNKEVTKVETIKAPAAPSLVRKTSEQAATADPTDLTSENNTENKNFPLTLAEMRKHDPATDPETATRLYRVTYTYCQQNPNFPPKYLPMLVDHVLAGMVRKSFSTGPKGHGIGLLFMRVPKIAVTLTQEKTS